MEVNPAARLLFHKGGAARTVITFIKQGRNSCGSAFGVFQEVIIVINKEQPIFIK